MADISSIVSIPIVFALFLRRSCRCFYTLLWRATFITKVRISIGFNSISGNSVLESISFFTAAFHTKRLESDLSWLPPSVVSSAEVIAKPGKMFYIDIKLELKVIVFN